MLSELLSANPNYNVKYLSTSNGLSNNYVTCVCQDSKGFIWFGTQDGLNRWDGYQFKVYRNEAGNPNSLPDNFIRSIASTSDGNIWIGTNQSGVVRFNTNTETFYQYPIDYNNTTLIPDAYILTIFKQNDTTLWFGTISGLVTYKPSSDSFERVYLKPENSGNNTKESILSIFRINNNTIGIQSNIGVFKISNMQVSELELPSSFNRMHSLYETNPLHFSRNGDIWFADPETLFYCNKQTGKTKQFKLEDGTGLSSTDISGIYEDSKNNIWITTWDAGVNLFHPLQNTFTVFKDGDKQQFQLSNNIVTNIFEDSFDNIWITTEEGGICYLSTKNNRMQFYEHNTFNNNSLSNNNVGAFYSDKTGNIWIGTANGKLNKFEEATNRFESFTINHSAASASISGIEKGPNNTLYLCGWDLGLYSFNLQTKQFTNLLKQVPNLNYNNKRLTNVKGFAIDANGWVWLATHSENGITIYNPHKNTVYNATNAATIDSNIFRIAYPASIFTDSKNRMWITSNAGLYMYDGNYHEFKTSKDNSNSIGSNYVYSVYEDSYGIIWVSTSMGLDKITFTNSAIKIDHLNEQKHLLPNNIKNIISDNNNFIWLSSNAGITRFDQKKHETKYYQINKNIPVLEFLEQSCTKSQSGHLYFGTTHGFLRFHPDSLKKESPSPQIYITDFRIFNQSQKTGQANSLLKKSILNTDTIVLNYKQSLISFEYAAININSHEKTEYAYKMEGIDQEWIFAGTNRITTYANLKHGTYTFKVRTSNGNKLSEGNQTQIQIIIKPPFYQTKLAYISYLLLFLGALYIFRRTTINREKLKTALKLEKINIQNVQENNLMKLRFFTNISHEFRTPLTLIKVPLEKLIKSGKQLTTDEQEYQYSLMLNSVSRLDKMVTQLMDYRKMEAGSLVLEPRFGDIVEFCQKVYNNFIPLANQRSVSYTFHSSFDSKWMAFDADKLEKVLSNVLSNAFKNTPKAGRINITILPATNSSFIQINIEDSGIGISSDNLPHIFDRFYMVNSKETTKVQGTGIGLALAKELIEMHQGSIKAHSTEQQGTTFSIELPTNISAETDNEDSTPEPNNKPSEESHEPNEENTSLTTKVDKPRLLLVDDDDKMLEFLRRELKETYEVTTATNGQEGLDLAIEHKPDIVVSDVMMPIVSGIEMCDKLKKNELTSHIPIVLLTARYSQEKKNEGLISGANAYILKPFNLEELLLTLSNLLANRKKLIEKFKTDTAILFEDEELESTDQKLMHNIINLVLSNISDNKINADFIAKQVFVSRTVLYLKIEALTGQTVNEFINSIRLKKAKQLLLTGDQNISEVSFAVGFTSQSYFSRTFTKQFGYSPSDYIRQNKTN